MCRLYLCMNFLKRVIPESCEDTNIRWHFTRETDWRGRGKKTLILKCCQWSSLENMLLLREASC